MLGFLNINKPSGVTSNFIVNNVKRKLNTKKVGHFGTLDPLASGVLPIAVGRATKLFDYFLDKEKVYIATFEFGYLTDTLDSEGIIEERTQIIPTKEDIERILPTFKGKQAQIPPMYSAKNVNGVRAYTLARKGEKVELKPKDIEIFNIELIEQVSKTVFKFKIHCSSGTYIRSIARDLGEKLNSLGTMIGLIRSQSGIFKLNNAIDINDDNLVNKLITIEEVLPNVPKITVDEKFYTKLTNGVSIYYKVNIEECLVYCKDELFGIGRVIDNSLKVKINLREI
ncbi:MAG: tRNA pseudouridine(55) synthase TruB [Clostridia bacterium]|nr:tRNA pseudouridine(55) synthase TruB [Clostridia bacterium]